MLLVACLRVGVIGHGRNHYHFRPPLIMAAFRRSCRLLGRYWVKAKAVWSRTSPPIQWGASLCVSVFVYNTAMMCVSKLLYGW